MRKQDFFYDLPSDRIARWPLEQRTDSRLLVLEAGKSFLDSRFLDLPDWLCKGDLLVLNDTRVIPARLFGRKASGGRIECLLERVIDDKKALVHLRASKSPKPGAMLEIEGGHSFRVLDRVEGLFIIEWMGDGNILNLLDSVGHVPLPPYIDREDAEADRERYQTVFAKHPGAVAAPTAGLHFDQEMLSRINSLGVEAVTVTLHVGSGTFLPLRVDDLEQHVMHKERVLVRPEAIEAIRLAKARGGRVIAVGTTAVRALESSVLEGVIRPFDGETDLFIRPGYAFKVVDALLTNFHLPESTLLALVCAFGGHARVMAAYRHAVEARYRFFSYGDAMFLTRNESADA